MNTGSFIGMKRYARSLPMAMNHIPPHSMWLHIFEGSELSDAAVAHIVSCTLCLHVVLICLKSETFASVLRTLEEESAA